MEASSMLNGALVWRGRCVSAGRRVGAERLGAALGPAPARRQHQLAAGEAVLVPRADAVRLAVHCVTSLGVAASDANTFADVLIAADYRGHYSHGLNRLHMYVNDIRTHVTGNVGQPQILKQSPATAWVDGCNLLGPVVGAYCMQLAIDKARQSGVGWVACKGSNHYGIAGYYALMAVRQGLIGLSFTNTSPLVVPSRAKKPIIGTNPLCFAAPGATEHDDFVLDMATSTAAIGKCEIKQRWHKPIPAGWGVDAEGHQTNDPSKVLVGGGLMPLGGLEESGGYKGYGLGAMVEVLCGILAGAAYGPHIRRWMTTDKVADLGQCFISVDTSCFAPGFASRLSAFADTLRGLEPLNAGLPVLLSGDPERAHEQHCDTLGGIPYHKNQVDHLNELAHSLQVEPLKSRPLPAGS